MGRARSSVLDPRAGQPSQGLSGARAWLGPAARAAWQVVAGGCVGTPGQRSRCLSPSRELDSRRHRDTALPAWHG